MTSSKFKINFIEYCISIPLLKLGLTFLRQFFVYFASELASQLHQLRHLNTGIYWLAEYGGKCDHTDNLSIRYRRGEGGR